LGDLPDFVDADVFGALVDRAFGPQPEPAFGESHALLVVHHGRIVAERYGPGYDETTPLLSWSMAKSVLHALVGILADQGRLDPNAPAAVPEWSGPDDPRAAITLIDLLRMVDGLDFNETYALPDPQSTDKPETAWSHCIDMLFGAGAADVAGYASGRPLAAAPGTRFNYSSGTSNIVARIVGDLIGGPTKAPDWMCSHLFDPIGMTSAQATFDAAGTFVGSSYFHATARDWARFGLLYLRGGKWDGHQVVPRDWVDQCRQTTAIDDDGGRYGTHWWTTDDGRGTFYASGFEIQRVICVPANDLVVVRLGKTPQELYETPKSWLNDLIALFDQSPPTA